MATVTFPESPNGDSPKPTQNNSFPRRRSTALTLAASIWPSSSRLFPANCPSEDYDETGDELETLLAQLDALSPSANADVRELFRYHEMLREAALSVQMRWKVLHQLRTMALTDELTGLYNRRGFLLLGVHNLRLASRSEQPHLLFFADVDGLKRVNDTCGHIQGDAILVACGEVLKMTFRESDIIARMGGDEFAILAQNSSGESREAILARLNSSLEFINRDVLPPFRLSVSVGAAVFNPASPVSLAELLSIADREMLEIKCARFTRELTSLLDNGSVDNANGNS